MKIAGYILIIFGFLFGAYLTSVNTTLVNWNLFIPTMLIGFAGVYMVRRSSKKITHSEETFQDNILDLENSLKNLIYNLGNLDERKNEINVYDFHEKLDELMTDDIKIFVDARHTISHLFSIQAYADIMSNFAGGERYINRIWSASVDGYIDEVHDYIGKAKIQFEAAQKKLLNLKDIQQTEDKK